MACAQIAGHHCGEGAAACLTVTHAPSQDVSLGRLDSFSGAAAAFILQASHATFVPAITSISLDKVSITDDSPRADGSENVDLILIT